MIGLTGLVLEMWPIPDSCYGDPQGLTVSTGKRMCPVRTTQPDSKAKITYKALRHERRGRRSSMQEQQRSLDWPLLANTQLQQLQCLDQINAHAIYDARTRVATT
jgi:hypothetical protein